jgi:thioesterase domain-containing protein
MFVPEDGWSVGFLAAEYVRLLRKRWPSGPYRLLGFSFGGTVAYEMAQQLTAAGEAVIELALLDICLPTAVSRGVLRSAIIRARRALPTLSADGRLQVRHLRAIERYIVRAFAGPVLLVRAQGTLTEVGADLIDQSYGWHAHVARLEILDLPCDHVGTLESPHVGGIARRLAQRSSTVQLEST